MKISRQFAIAVSSGMVVVLSGVVLAASNDANQSLTSLQNTAGNGTLIDALGQPSTDLSVAVESGKKPNVSFKINGQNIPTDKPGVTPFSQTAPDGSSVNGQVATSGSDNSGNVSLNLSGQNSSYSASTSVTPGNSTNSNQTTTTTTFNNGFSNINSNSFTSSSSFNSSTIYSNGQVQQSP